MIRRVVECFPLVTRNRSSRFNQLDKRNAIARDLMPMINKNKTSVITKINIEYESLGREGEGILHKGVSCVIFEY